MISYSLRFVNVWWYIRCISALFGWWKAISLTVEINSLWWLFEKKKKKQCLLMNLCQRWISFVNEGSCKHDFDVQTYVKCSKLCNLLYLGFVMVRGELLIPTCIDSFFRNNSFLSKLINGLNETNLSEQTFYFSLKPWKITNQFNFFQCWLKGFNKPRL